MRRKLVAGAGEAGGAEIEDTLVVFELPQIVEERDAVPGLVHVERQAVGTVANAIGPDDSAVRFLSLASHELRGPLGTVRTYAALLASPRFALEERVRTAVEVMLRNVDRALASWELLAEAWRLDVDGLRLDLRDEDLVPSLRASAE